MDLVVGLFAPLAMADDGLVAAQSLAAVARDAEMPAGHHH